jgi:hypothetical protein
MYLLAGNALAQGKITERSSGGIKDFVIICLE